jgi:hypothetical protein
MSAEDIVRKFRLNVSDIMPASKSDRIVDIVLSLDRRSDLQQLMAELG